jgi:chromate transporter
MEDELVRRRQWLSREKFSTCSAQAISSQARVQANWLFISVTCAGWRGPLIDGSFFILPAALMVAGLGWIYFHFGRLPATVGILYGIKPVSSESFFRPFGVSDEQR